MYNKRVERRADCESTEVSSLRVYVSERASRSGREEWERQGSGGSAYLRARHWTYTLIM